MKYIATLYCLLLVLQDSKSQTISSKQLEIDYRFDSLSFNHESWKSLDSIFNDKKCFFLGEHHGVASNPMMHFKTFVYLYYYHNVRTYIMEAHYSYAYFVNKFIQTGNKKYLEQIQLYDDSVSNVYLHQYQMLYRFNKTLPNHQKITITSIDTEAFYYTPSMVRDFIKQKGSIPITIKKTFERLMNYRIPDRFAFLPKKYKKEVKKMLQELKGNLSSNLNDFKQFLGKDYVHLDMVINNNATLRRSDAGMFKNFIEKIIANYPKGGYYFQYGSLHARLKAGWLANMVNKSKKYSRKVVSINTEYNNCDYWYGKLYKNQNFGAVQNLPTNLKKLYKEHISQINQQPYTLVFLELKDKEILFFNISNQ